MDGMWPIWHHDRADPRTTSLFSLERYRERPEIEYALLHELMHQLGVIDLYRMHIDTRAMLLPDANRPSQKAGCGTDYWPHDYMCFRFPENIEDLMGAGPFTIGAHTAGALKSNTGHRRGHYGEYLYDTPATVALKIVDQYGQDLPNVDLRFYQYEHKKYGHILDAIPEFELTTDDTGKAMLPNRGKTGVVTATGHQLRPNPFGAIDVTGTNGTFVIEMHGPCSNYEWLTLVELNLAYWDGYEDHAIFNRILRCPPQSEQARDGNISGPTDVSVPFASVDVDKDRAALIAPLQRYGRRKLEDQPGLADQRSHRSVVWRNCQRRWPWLPREPQRQPIERRDTGAVGKP